MRLRDAMETGCDGFSACAAAHAWRLAPSPLPPSSPPRELKGEGGMRERTKIGNLPNGCPGTVRAYGKSGFLITVLDVRVVLPWTQNDEV